MGRSFDEVMEFTRGVSAPDAFQDVECKAFYDSLLKVRPGGIVVEIGCQLGRSSSIIAQLQSVVGYNAIHIDPYTEQPDYLRGWIEMMIRTKSKWTLMCMQSQETHWLFDALSGWLELDFVFVDGDHEYPSVIHDLQFFGARVKRGGILCAHDSTNPGLPGVNQAIQEYISPAWHEIGVFGSLAVWLKK